MAGKKKTEQDYRDLAKERGFEWVGDVFPKNVRIPTKWKCSEGHEWEARYNDIQQGTGCPECFRLSLFGHKPSEKEEVDYHALAKERGFQWIGGVLPRNVMIPTKWKCSEDHEWDARYANIQRGTGCPQCAGTVPKTDKDYHDLAKECGFEWIGGVLPPNTGIPTKWKCLQGHEWEARYNDIHRRGCPECAGLASKTDKDYHDLAKDRGFQWIGGMLPRNVMTKTKWMCLEEHEWDACYHTIQQEHGCPHCAGNAPKIEKDYHNLAKEHGFEWIGDMFPPNVNTRTKWRCPEDHEWEARYNDIQQGRGCPHCWKQRQQGK